MVKKKKEKTVKDILNIFIPKIWILFTVGAIFTACMCVYSFFLKKDTYTTTSVVLVSVDTTGGGMNDSQTTQLAQQTVKSYEEVIYRGVFLDGICAIISSDDALKGHFINEDSIDYQNATEAEKKNIITVEKLSARISEVYGENGITRSKLKKMISVKTAEETPSFVLNVTSADPMICSAVSKVLSDRIEDGVLDAFLKSKLGSEIIEYPEMNYSSIGANSKHTVRNSAIAFVIGFLLAAAAVWLFSTFDVVIRDASKIEENLDIPILGIIPRHEIGAEEVKRK